MAGTVNGCQPACFLAGLHPSACHSPAEEWLWLLLSMAASMHTRVFKCSGAQGNTRWASLHLNCPAGCRQLRTCCRPVSCRIGPRDFVMNLTSALCNPGLRATISHSLRASMCTHKQRFPTACYLSLVATSDGLIRPLGRKKSGCLRSATPVCLAQRSSLRQRPQVRAGCQR